MSNFDWSKVTVEQLRNVPQAVVGDGFRVESRPLPRAVLLSQGVFMASLWREAWRIEAMPCEAAREVVACIDRIVNYLRMCY